MIRSTTECDLDHTALDHTTDARQDRIPGVGWGLYLSDEAIGAKDLAVGLRIVRQCVDLALAHSYLPQSFGRRTMEYLPVFSALQLG